MRKVYHLDERFPTGEATVQPVLLWGANGRPLIEHVKTASEASDFIKGVTPKPGKTIVLVLAMGAYETYDLNRNGDGFNEFPYKQGLKPTCGCCDPLPGGWIQPDEILPAHYKSFEQYGKNYMHHVNKDEAKAVGDVLKAFWNPLMHRVELLVGVDNDRALEVVQRIADGDFPAVSMGCRIKYDVCTICGHRAPTRAKYCTHLKMSMRQVMSNGLRAGALNPSPKFFDISWVIKPADQTGFMMKKVAYAYEVRASAAEGEYLDNVEEKRAAIRKVADMDKIIRGIPVDAKSTPLSAAEVHNVEQYRDHILPAVVGAMPEMSDGTIKDLAKHPVANVLSTLSAAGVILTTPEFVKLIIEKLSPGSVVPEHALDAIVALQGQVFELYGQHPQMLDQMMETGLFDLNAKNVDPTIAEKAEEYLEKRSTIGEYMQRALIPPVLRDEEPHWSDTLHVRDPATGQLYATNRGAAVASHDAIAKRQLMKLVGGGALLAGGYKLLAAGLPPMLRPVAAGTTGLLGHKYLRPDFGPQYMTEEGIPVSTLTELTPEKTSNELATLALPLLGTGALITALGHDYDSRLRRGTVGDPNAPVHQRLFDRLGQYASDHPALSFLGTLGAAGIGANALGKFAEYFGDITEAVTDSVVLPNVNIDLAAEKLGALFTA
jgi:hypothetical protein